MQQPLESYYKQADQVAIGLFVSSVENQQNRSLSFSITDRAYKGSFELGETVSFVTGLTSAECGIIPEEDSLYVLFGYQNAEYTADPGLDTCSGTRVLRNRDSSQLGEFIDVPNKFVVSRLIALQGLETLGKVTAAYPEPGNPLNSSLIGLAELDFSGLDQGLPVYAEPDSNSLLLDSVNHIEAFTNREVAYEQPAAVVFAHTDFGFRIQLRDGRFGWIRISDTYNWHPYETLVVRRLGYLAQGWDGLVWPQPGAGNPSRLSVESDRNQALEVSDSLQIGASTWFKVNILDQQGCESSQSKNILSGWIPAYGTNGQPAVWFHSRGC
ncbi:MAG: hypothetical protein R3F41_00925 [Gammaproteobacteria bacterium]|nr:hypothetical protein [Pseudomonadales bacterium]